MAIKPVVKFNPDVVAKNIKQIIPDNSHYKAVVNGSIEIKSIWKRGKLTYIEINHEDITGKTNIAEAQYSLEEILMISHKFRREYTGTHWFVLEISGGYIKSVYRKEGNFIIKDSGLTQIWQLN